MNRAGPAPVPIGGADRGQSGRQTVPSTRLTCPPCDVGPPSIPDGGAPAGDAVHKLDSGDPLTRWDEAAVAGGV